MCICIYDTHYTLYISHVLTISAIKILSDNYGFYDLL